MECISIGKTSDFGGLESTGVHGKKDFLVFEFSHSEGDVLDQPTLEIPKNGFFYSFFFPNTFPEPIVLISLI